MDSIILIVLNFMWVPYTLIRIFPQAVSKTASNVTSHASFFFHIFFILSLPTLVFFGVFFFVWMSLKDLPFKQTQSHKSVRHEPGWGDGRDAAESCSQSSTLFFLFLLSSGELVKVSAARIWASLYWHCFKSALPVSEKKKKRKRRGQVSTGTPPCTLYHRPFSLSLSLSRSVWVSETWLLFYSLFDELSCLFSGLWDNED